MATSGTYSFGPAAGDLVLNAFGLVQIRRWELTQQHLEDAGIAANLLMVDISNRNPNRWEIETLDISLSQGTPTYNLETRTVAVALARIQTGTPPAANRRVIGPLSSTDYASLQNQLQQGAPTSFFFSLLTPTPTISVWPAPDANGPYTLQVLTYRQTQDVVLPGGVTLDTPYRFLDAWTYGLGARIADYYPEKLPPGGAAGLEAKYMAKFTLAAQQDQEKLPMYVRPQMSGYFR